jgi:DNA-binding winged helix-turn-helix (wHTH) protein/tetratricopeptide (TPR) repeat protein
MTEHKCFVFTFADVEVREREFCIVKAGQLLPVEPKAFRVLLFLLRSPHRLIKKDELLDAVWSDCAVSDNSLTRSIALLRRLLGDETREPRYIATVPTVGYRFLCDVKVVEDSFPGPHEARLLHLQNGNEENSIEVEPLPGTRSVEGTAHSPSEPLAVALAAGETTKRWKVIIPAAATVLAFLVAGYFYLHRAPHHTPKLTDKDTIVLGDFANTTGDVVFDDALKQGLSIQLEQSPFLDLVSEQKVNETLRLMGRTAGDRLTPEVTREVCQRTASKAMLTGSIATLGSQYVIGLRAVACDTGDMLGEAQQQAASKEAVLKALDNAAVSLRDKLGESLSSVQRYATPLEEATTPSLEALKAYSLGRKTFFAKGYTAELPLLKRAVELDPNFAIAYRAMSGVYGELNQSNRRIEYIRKAYELREKVSERERFLIEANYYAGGTGELEKAVTAYQLWEQTYPRDYLLHAQLGEFYGHFGNLDKALEEAREAVRLEPSSADNYQVLAADCIHLNRLDEAEAVFRQVEERKLENEWLPALRYQLAFLTGDAAQMAKLASAAMGKPGTEDLLLDAQANTEAWYGRLKAAREFTRRAADSAQHNDAKEAAARYLAQGAVREVESGDREQARGDADASVKLGPNGTWRATAALALARAGDTAGAEKLAAQLDKDFPLDTLVQRYRLPTIRAAVALQRKDPKRAIELLRAASAIELGDRHPLFPVYLRGEAYLMLHDGNRAAAEFQKFVDHHSLMGNFAWGAPARLQLGRAFALSGDKTKAKAAYQDFLTLWKDADPDLPILKKAKAEYAKL